VVEEQAERPQRQAEQPLPTAGLLLLRDELVRADVALKSADPTTAYSAYKQLGRYFTQLMQLERAAMFYGRCCQVGGLGAYQLIC
jgi:hypothetical protein